VISVAVMAHPRRAAWVEGLQRDFPQATVAWDERGEEWHTGRRALLAYDQAATHHLVLQDDAIACPDLIEAAERAVGAAGERPVSLYAGRVRPDAFLVYWSIRRARAAGIPWIELPGPRWGVAIIVPTAHIPGLVAAGDAYDFWQYDRKIGCWYEERGLKCWYTVPSLVDHRPLEESPSLLAGNDHEGSRQAHWFIGSDASPLEIDWARSPLPTPERVTFRSPGLGRQLSAPVGSDKHARLDRAPDWHEETADGVDPDLPEHPLDDSRVQLQGVPGGAGG
jgi:hypothetical protein